jgi:hypothetical protein
MRFEPVVWLTAAAVFVSALLAADAEYHVLPAAWARWLAFGAMVAGLVAAGVKTRGAVTPLADPRNDAGDRLVPRPTPTRLPTP